MPVASERRAVEGPAIECRGLTKSYGTRRAVQGIDLDIAPGRVVGFLGPNGAGKTTVIRILTTILAPDAGTFSVAGVPGERPREIRRRIGVLPESAGYPANQTGEQVLRYFARLYGLSHAEAKATAGQLLERVGLAERGGSLLAGYSRGMRQRLGIARALVNNPAVIFLDEPTLGLNPAGQRQVLQVIARAAREEGTTILLSTHLLAEVENVCDDVIVVDAGRIVAQGSVHEIARRAAAPREGRVRVPAPTREAALETLGRLPMVAKAVPGDSPEEIRFVLREGFGPADGSAGILAGALGAGLHLEAFEFEGGRLSDAFLSITARDADGPRELVDQT